MRIAAAKTVLASITDEVAKKRESACQADAILTLVKKSKAKLDAEERNYLIEAVQGVVFAGDDKLRIVASLAPLFVASLASAVAPMLAAALASSLVPS